MPRSGRAHLEGDARVRFAFVLDAGGGARLCRAGAGAGEERATEKEGFEPSMEEFTPITP